MNRILVAIAASLLVSGCATNWQKTGAGDADFRVDNGQCRAQALSATGGMGGLAMIAQTEAIREACLEGKGWVPAK